MINTTNRIASKKTNKTVLVVNENPIKNFSSAPRKKSLVKPSTKKNIINTISAGSVGGIIPLMTYLTGHFECPNLFTQELTHECLTWLVVIGGLIYSAPSLIEWGKPYFGVFKSIGFVLCLEMSMTFTHSPFTNIPSLLMLIGINSLITLQKFTTVEGKN